MKYQILVLTGRRKWEEVDTEDYQPTFTFQANDLAELQDRQADFSRNLKLPKSKKNSRIFGMANLNAANSDTPYRKLSCRVHSGMYQLFGPGSYMVLLKVSDYFEVQILGGNASLFTTLEKSPMADLDLGTVQVLPGVFDGSLPVPEGVHFPYATFKAGRPTEFSANMTDLFPAVELWHVLRKLSDTHGYTLKDNLPDTEKGVNTLLSVNPVGENFDWAQCVGESTNLNMGRYTLRYDGQTGLGEYVLFPYVSKDLIGFYKMRSKRVEDVNNIIQDVPASEFTAICSGKLKIKIHISAIMPAYLQLYLMTYVNLVDQTVHTVGRDRDWEIEFELNAGDRVALIYMIKRKLEGDALSNAKLKATLTFTPDEEIAAMPIHIAQGLGFDTQMDFFKYVAQVYGLFVYADENARVIHAYTGHIFYDYIQQGKFLDWSPYVQAGYTPTRQYKVGKYGKVNVIKFEDNDADGVDERTPLTDRGTFRIDDDTLDSEKELFCIAGQSGWDHENTYKMANIPIKSSDGSGVNEVSTHLLRSHEDVDAYIPSLEKSVPMPRVTHIKAQELIDNWYAPLISGMLDQAQVIEEQLMLSIKDIANRDPFMPVYLEKYGAYFYVNKISNFEPGKLTKVELIKL